MTLNELIELSSNKNDGKSVVLEIPVLVVMDLNLDIGWANVGKLRQMLAERVLDWIKGVEDKKNGISDLANSINLDGVQVLDGPARRVNRRALDSAGFWHGCQWPGRKGPGPGYALRSAGAAEAESRGRGGRRDQGAVRDGGAAAG